VDIYEKDEGQLLFYWLRASAPPEMENILDVKLFLFP
jgi:hypothetical protein